MFPILNESFLFVVQKILNVTSVSVTPKSDEEREIQALRRCAPRLPSVFLRAKYMEEVTCVCVCRP
jgi:hypothetical protein